MEVKRFVGRSMEEALKKTKQEFGKDAVILYTYAPEANFFQKLFGTQKFIVIAGKDINLVSDGAPPEKTLREAGVTDLLEEKYSSSDGNTSVADFLRDVARGKSYGDGNSSSNPADSIPSKNGKRPPQRSESGRTQTSNISSQPESRDHDDRSENERNTSSPETPFDPDGRIPEPEQNGSRDRAPKEKKEKSIKNIEYMLRDLTDMVKHDKLSETNEELFKNYKKMLENNISRMIAMNIIEKLQEEMDPGDLENQEAIQGGLQDTIKNMIPVSGPIEPGVNECNSVAVVGPTGVGKTTTVAKLAGNFVLRENCSVGLLTIDTYRLGAATQLQKVASLLEIPCKSAKNPRDFRQTLTEMEEYDLVFIDTLGTSQKDADKIKRLNEFFRAKRPDQVHLVLSANSKDDVLQETIDSFSVLDIDRVIFSKIDEATRLGLIINILNEINTGISYVTTGQEIPKDIREASDEEIASMILGEGDHA